MVLQVGTQARLSNLRLPVRPEGHAVRAKCGGDIFLNGSLEFIQLLLTQTGHVLCRDVVDDVRDAVEFDRDAVEGDERL